MEVATYQNNKKMIMRIVIIISLIIILLWIFWQDMKPLSKKSRREKDNNIYDSAYSLRKECKYREAIKLYKKYLAINQTDWIALGDIGHCFYQLGEVDNAYSYTYKALRINPECIEHKSVAAIIQAEQFEDFKKAQQLLDSIEKQLKSHDELWDNLKEIHYMDKAWISLKKGDTKEALDYFDKSINEYFLGHVDELDEIFSSIHYRIAIFYKLKRNLVAAKLSFSKSIKSGGPECIFSKISEEELGKMQLERSNDIIE